MARKKRPSPRNLLDWVRGLKRPPWIPPNKGVQRWTPKHFDMQGASPHPPDRPNTGQYVITIRRDGWYHQDQRIYDTSRVVHMRSPRRVVPVQDATA